MQRIIKRSKMLIGKSGNNIRTSSMTDYFFVDLLFVVCSFWVFLDACYNKIGIYQKDKRNRGRSPIWWGVLSTLIPIIFVPFYLIRRKSLIETATNHPVIGDKSLGIFVLLILNGLIIWFSNIRYWY